MCHVCGVASWCFNRYCREAAERIRHRRVIELKSVSLSTSRTCILNAFKFHRHGPRADASMCPPNSDRSFGPRVDSAPRSFDFTIQFEDICLFCLPAAAFLFCSCAQLARLARHGSFFSLRSKLFGCRMVRTALQLEADAKINRSCCL